MLLLSIILFFNAGNVYIADFINFAIRKVTVSTDIITTIAGSGSSGFSGDGSQATSAMLNFPFGVALDSPGMVISRALLHCLAHLS